MANKIRKLLMSVSVFAISLGSLLTFSAPIALAAPAYDYQLITQSAYPATLAPGATTNVWIEVKNTGTATWKNTGSNVTRLGSGSAYGAANQQRDYVSEFANSDWPSANRAAAMLHPEIRPGWHTRFQFNIKAPTTAGTYKAYFTPVTDGLTWMKDIGIYWQLTVSGTPGETPPPSVPSGSLGVSLASSTPAAGTVIADTTSADGAQAQAKFTSLIFTAGSGTAKVTSVKIKRSGVAADTDISNMYLYNGNTRLADSPVVSATYYTFTNSNGIFSVTAGTPLTIDVKADIANGTGSGKTIALGINAVSDITSDATSVTGAPVVGNSMQVATVSDLGKLTVANVLPVGATTTTPGLTDQEVWKFSLTAADQAIKVNYLKVTAIGTIETSALTNLKLHDGVSQVGSTVAGLASDKTVVFDLSSSPYSLTAGAIKNISLRADITGGSGRNFYFSIQNVADLVAMDNGYSVYIKPNQSDTFAVVQAGGTTSISAGSLQITLATDSSSGNVAKDALGVTLAKYNFKAIGEAIKVSSLIIRTTVGGALDADNVDNGKILLDDVQVGTTKDLDSDATPDANTTDDDAATDDDTTFTFGSSFVINAGATRVLKIVGDIKKGAGTSMAANDTIQLTLEAGTNNYQRMTTGTTDNSASVGANQLTVSAAALSTVKNPSVANKTLVKGAQGTVIGSWLITAGAAEGIDVTSLNIIDRNAADGANGAQGIGSAYDVLKVMVGSIQYGATANSVSTAAGTTVTFNFSTPITINAGQSLQVDLAANVLTNATWTATDAIKVSSVTGVGKTTSQTVTDAAGGIGQQLTVAAAGTLTVANEATPTNPSSTLVVSGKTGLTMAAWKFSADNTENLVVTRIKLKEIHADNVPGNVKNLGLYVNNALVGSMAPALTTGAPDYAIFEKTDATGLFTVPKNGNITVVLKAEITGAADATFGANGKNVQFEVTMQNLGSLTATSDISARGATSNTYALEGVGGDTNYDANLMKVVKTKPTFALATNSPSGTLIPGTVEVMRFNVTADSANDVTMTAAGGHNLRFTITSNKSALVAVRAFDLYDSATDAIIATQVTAIPNSGVTVDFAAGFSLTIPAGQTKVLYVKANLQDFTTLGDSFQLSIQNAAADFSWSDGTTAADISDTLTGKGLPLYANTLVKP